MLVAMMGVWIVGMAVNQFLVAVRMGMRLTWRIGRRMRMLVVFVMDMEVVMKSGLVTVPMGVSLCQMQPDSKPH